MKHKPPRSVFETKHEVVSDWPTTSVDHPRCGLWKRGVTGPELPDGVVQLPEVGGGVVAIRVELIAAIEPFGATQTRIRILGSPRRTIELTYEATLDAIIGA